MPPETGPAFETMMREIDAQLVRDGTPIPSRPMQAVMAVGSRYKISIPFGSRSSFRLPPELSRYAQLSQNILDWYDSVYGDRIKLDFSPGKMVLMIEGDRYLMSMPRLFGAAHYFASRQFMKTEVVTREPARCNVVQLVDGLTPAKAARLSDQTLHYISQHFALGVEAHDLLEATQDLDLIQIARGDIQTAVSNLMDRGDRFGESKWASLQAAEKTLKAAISLEGDKFKFSHQLERLCEQLATLGVICEWAPLIGKIQCSPGIRYGEVQCSLDEAVDAHHASLRLVVALAKAGVKFKRSIGGISGE
jgi:hypothetical protein